MSVNPTFVLRNGQLIITPEGNLLVGDPTCCCDGEGCRVPTEWKLVDGTDTYAEGLIGIVNDVPSLMNFPDPWIPIFYYNENINMELKVKDCGNDWETIETFNVNIDVCNNNRYPEHSFDGSWEPPSDCKCKNDAAVDAGLEECDPCPYLSIGSTGVNINSGSGVKFTGSVNGDSTNLANWEDSNQNSPASSIANNIVIEGNIDYGNINGNQVTINGNVSVSVTAQTLVVNGEISGEPLCGCENPCECITVTANTLSGSGRIGGPGIKISGINVFENVEIDVDVIQGPVTFRGLTFQGTIVGDAIFEQGAALGSGGLVTGNTTFIDSTNNGIILGTSHIFTRSTNASGARIGGSAGEITCAASLDNFFREVSVTFNDSTNAGTVLGSGTLNNSINTGDINGGFDRTTTFNSGSANQGYGRVLGNNVVFNNSTNSATLEDNLSVIFTGNSVNTITGTVVQSSGFIETENPSGTSFSGSSINRGSVDGVATFTECAYNDGGTADTFVPNPPPDAPVC